MQAAAASTIVDDLGTRAPKKKKKTKLSPLMAVLVPVFGKNAEKVQTILEAWVGYAETFTAANDGWTDTSTEYKEARATRLYRAGMLCQRIPARNACCPSLYLSNARYLQGES